MTTHFHVPRRRRQRHIEHAFLNTMTAFWLARAFLRAAASTSRRSRRHHLVWR
jgi:hypothetical protein